MHWKMIDPDELNIRQVIRNLAALLFVAVLVLAGCQGQSILDSIFPQANTQLGGDLPTPTPGQNIGVDITPTPENPIFYQLELWVPPQFDPNGESDASKLLNQRLHDFLIQNPQVNLDVRVKAQAGPGGMMDSLNGASTVAQGALPSLVLLGRSDLVTAAGRNLIYPIEEVSSSVDENDWFTFARNMAIYQGSAYGLPFSSNAIGLLYRENTLTGDQPSWDEVLRRLNTLIFPAGDAEALVTLALYQSAGGNLDPQMGQVEINQEALASVFNIYDLARRSGVIRRDVLDLQTEEQAWNAFINSSADAAIVWANRIFSADEPLGLALLPLLGNEPLTLATGWSWCLTDNDEQKRVYAAALAEYLSSPDFLSIWAPVSGYLPVRPSSLAGFKEEGLKSSLSVLLASARLRPDRQIVKDISAQLEAAAGEVLSGSMTPEEGVQSVIAHLEDSEIQ
jgi:multiple sugar transport system substrate-binding protein